jgi:hypothetical protein
MYEGFTTGISNDTAGRSLLVPKLMPSGDKSSCNAAIMHDLTEKVLGIAFWLCVSSIGITGSDIAGNVEHT